MNNEEKLTRVIEAALLAAYEHLHPYDKDSPRKTVFMRTGLEAANTTLAIVAKLT